MTDAKNVTIPKLPFLCGGALLLILAELIVWRGSRPVSTAEAISCVVLAVIGATIGILPFILEYKAFIKTVEVNALGAAVDQIQNLEKVAGQLSSATEQWTRVQEIVQTNADKTASVSKQIADKMGEEARQFSEFMQKMNDSEKAALRLETEKLHRGEAEWLQTLVHILDHIFALHTAAVRSGQPELANQIAHFQNACRGLTRRVGLAAFSADANKPFDPERHQLANSKTPPPAGAIVAETVGSGYTFQGRLLRHALVRVRQEGSETPAENKPVSDETPATELPLE